MTVWTNEKLRAAIEGGAVVPFDPSNIQQAAYELGVANEYAVTTPEGEGARIRATEGNDIKIPAGHFALLLTKEIIRLPPDAIGFISVKASLKLKGLVNVSGFHVDPGFHGRLKFSVYNASGKSLYIQPGRPLFQIWLNGLVEELPEDKLYKNKHPPETGILDDDVTSIGGIVASPAGLSARIDTLDDRLTHEVPNLDTSLRKVIADLGHSFDLQLQKESKDLAVKLESLRARQSFQWYVLGVLVVAILIAPLNDCLKARRNSGEANSSSHSTPLTVTPTVTPTVAPTSNSDASTMSSSALVDAQIPVPAFLHDAGSGAP